jgi:Protein of unknown function (DUF3102)
MSARSTDSLNSKALLPSKEQTSQETVLAENVASIRQLSKRVIGDVIEIGRRLSDCKTLLGHGKWLSWIESEFSWTDRKARNFIAAYEFARSKSEKISDLGIDVSSLYLLAAPSTPEKARVEVLRGAEAEGTLPHAEVKRIIGEARGREVAAGTTKRPPSLKEYFKAHRQSDFFKLLAVERRKILDARPERLDLAIADATTRQKWKRFHRELQDALDASEITAKRSPRKIIAAIPVEAIPTIAARVKAALDFLVKLDAKLGQHKNKNIGRTGAGDDATSLAELLMEARKTYVKKYGRPDHAQILETFWADLNSSQIALLCSGQFGPIIKATAERLMRVREATE